MSYAFPPEERILLRPLAEKLNTKTHQVRDALLLLAGEDWVIQADKKGFFAKRPDPAVFAEYSSVNCFLLEAALYAADPTKPIPDGLRKRLSTLRDSASRKMDDAESLATTIAEVFVTIAKLGNNDIVAGFVAYCNEQLHYQRIQECKPRNRVPPEIVTFCELALEGEFAALREAIVAFHDR